MLYTQNSRKQTQNKGRALVSRPRLAGTQAKQDQSLRTGQLDVRQVAGAVKWPGQTDKRFNTQLKGKHTKRAKTKEYQDKCKQVLSPHSQTYMTELSSQKPIEIFLWLYFMSK